MRKWSERSKAGELLEQLKANYPDASVRLQGELVPVADLANHAVFLSSSRPTVARAETGTPAVLRSLSDGLVPIWQYRFTDPEPYRKASSSKGGNRRFVQGETGANAAPGTTATDPGGSVRFDEGRLVFMDHYRLRVHDLGSGLVGMASLESDRPPKPRSGKARSRIPVYDYSAMRVAGDGDRYYCVVGPQGSTNLPQLDPILRNQLVAYDRAEPAAALVEQRVEVQGTELRGRHVPRHSDGVWSAPTRADPRAGRLRVAGNHGVDRRTVVPDSPPQWWKRARASARRSGASFTAGTAYVLTNAGTLAAVDAFTGELHWVRRYERTHPYRPTRKARKRSRNRSQFGMNQGFRHLSLDGFVPSELIVVDGRILFGPSDGDVLLCLDGASGEVLWVATKPSGSNVHVIGHDEKHLYLGGGQMIGGVASGSSLVVCLDYRSGVRLWASRLA